MIDREPRPLRPPRPLEGAAGEDAYEPEVEHESLLEPGVLGERFARARAEGGQARPRRWLADLIGHARSDAVPQPSPPASQLTIAAPLPPAPADAGERDLDRNAASLDDRTQERDAREHELRALARRDESLREREQWIASRREELQRRIEELESVERSLELREREVLRREEAAARWFTELNRMQRLIEEKHLRLEPARACDDEPPPHAQVARPPY